MMMTASSVEEVPSKEGSSPSSNSSNSSTCPNCINLSGSPSQGVNKQQPQQSSSSNVRILDNPLYPTSSCTHHDLDSLTLQQIPSTKDKEDNLLLTPSSPPHQHHLHHHHFLDLPHPPKPPSSPFFLGHHHHHLQHHHHHQLPLSPNITLRDENARGRLCQSPFSPIKHPHHHLHHLPPHPSSSSSSSSASVIGLPSVTFYPRVNHCHQSPRRWIMDDHHPSYTGIENMANTTGTGSSLVGQSIYGNTTSSGNHIRDWTNNSDRWETNTAITVNTSLHSGGGSFEMDLNLIGKDGRSEHRGSPKFFSSRRKEFLGLLCQMYSGLVVSSVICVSAFLSPLLMVTLAKTNPRGWSVTSDCGPECDGLLISFSFKYLLLLMASWLMFVRKPRATLPRVNSCRAALLVVNLLLLVAYWAFFIQRSVDRRISDYDVPLKDLLASYPIPMLDILVVVHYLAVIWTEVRHQRPEFAVKVIRSPDGVAKSYTIGDLSIQRTAVYVLEKYYVDFPVFNSGLEMAQRKKIKGQETIIPMETTTGNGIKYYGDVDSGLSGCGTNGSTVKSPPNGNISTMAVNGSPSVSHLFRNNGQVSKKSHSVVGVESSRRSSSHRSHGSSVGGRRSERTSSRERSDKEGHHHHHKDKEVRDDRFHDDLEFERRVKKRKFRLLSAAEEAFTHVKLIDSDPSVSGQGPAISMDPRETAQSIFPSMARPLQKFLRQTRSQGHQSLSSILDHLSLSMKYGLSAKAFLEPYISQSPVLADDRERGKDMQSWGLVSDVLLSRSIEDGMTFMLRQGDVQLLVVVSKLPYLNLEEEVIDTKSNRFVFRMNSETSV